MTGVGPQPPAGRRSITRAWQSHKMNKPSTATVVATRRYATPPTRAFDAWLDPEFGRWMFRTVVPDETIVRLQTDPRVGGAFSFVVLRQGQEIDHVGEYLEFDRPAASFSPGASRELAGNQPRVDRDHAGRRRLRTQPDARNRSKTVFAFAPAFNKAGPRCWRRSIASSPRIAPPRLETCAAKCRMSKIKRRKKSE